MSQKYDNETASAIAQLALDYAEENGAKFALVVGDFLRNYDKKREFDKIVVLYIADKKIEHYPFNKNIHFHRAYPEVFEAMLLFLTLGMAKVHWNKDATKLGYSLRKTGLYKDGETKVTTIQAISSIIGRTTKWWQGSVENLPKHFLRGSISALKNGATKGFENFESLVAEVEGW